MTFIHIERPEMHGRFTFGEIFIVDLCYEKTKGNSTSRKT